jgi:hypothetical protein
MLNRSDYGYFETLIGADTLANDHFVPPGDEIPRGCIEAAYLPGVFPDNRSGKHASPGSALGFRTGDFIEWLCFDRPIDDILSTWIWKKSTKLILVKKNIHPDHKRKLFNLVAYMPKGLEQRRVRGANKEHVQWYTSLLGAKHRPLRLKLIWKKFGTELKRQHDADRADAELLRKEEEARRDAEEDVADNDEGRSDIDANRIDDLQDEFYGTLPTGPPNIIISLNAGGIVHGSSTPILVHDEDSESEMEHTPSKPPLNRP